MIGDGEHPIAPGADLHRVCASLPASPRACVPPEDPRARSSKAPRLSKSITATLLRSLLNAVIGYLLRFRNSQGAALARRHSRRRVAMSMWHQPIDPVLHSMALSALA